MVTDGADQLCPFLAWKSVTESVFKGTMQAFFGTVISDTDATATPTLHVMVAMCVSVCVCV